MQPVMRDNRRGEPAARYLIERGHRNIAYIGGRDGCRIREQRLLGFRSAMTQNGSVWREEYSPACTDDTQAAAMATRQLLEKNNTITALLCHSPDAMIGSISGIHRGAHGGQRRVLTQQVALIGFEDMLHVNLTSPSLTYVSSASEETGRRGRADDPQAERAGPANAAHNPLRAAYRAGIGVKSEFSMGL